MKPTQCPECQGTLGDVKWTNPQGKEIIFLGHVPYNRECKWKFREARAGNNEEVLEALRKVYSKLLEIEAKI